MKAECRRISASAAVKGRSGGTVLEFYRAFNQDLKESAHVIINTLTDVRSEKSSDPAQVKESVFQALEKRKEHLDSLLSQQLESFSLGHALMKEYGSLNKDYSLIKAEMEVSLANALSDYETKQEGGWDAEREIRKINNDSYVSIVRITELESIDNNDFDLATLIQLCREARV